jgi:hypothetical protein
MLLSDVNNLMRSIAHDFPEIATMYSIGKSFEGRDINVVELTSSPEAKAAMKKKKAEAAKSEEQD